MYRMEEGFNAPRDLETRREEPLLGFYDGKRWHTASVRFSRELDALTRRA